MGDTETEESELTRSKLKELPKTPGPSSSLGCLPPGKKGMDAGFNAALLVAIVGDGQHHSIATIRVTLECRGQLKMRYSAVALSRMYL